jgi:hypothetical protein
MGGSMGGFGGGYGGAGGYGMQPSYSQPQQSYGNPWMRGYQGGYQQPYQQGFASPGSPFGQSAYQQQPQFQQPQPQMPDPQNFNTFNMGNPWGQTPPWMMPSQGSGTMNQYGTAPMQLGTQALNADGTMARMVA